MSHANSIMWDMQTMTRIILVKLSSIPQNDAFPKGKPIIKS